MRILIAIAVAGILGATLAAQRRPLPIVDVHLHAIPADGNGPPPLAMCTPFTDWMRDSKDDWNTVFLSRQKTPPCRDPVWSPTSDDSLMNETLTIMRRRNMIGVVSGSLEYVRRWRRAAPDHVIPAVPFDYNTGNPSPDALARLHEDKELAVLAEIGNQYEGILPSDPLLQPYFVMAEARDIPIGIHIGTGPPGAPYLPGLEKYRAKLHSPLVLEEVLIRHPRLRVYIMHAGWPMLDDLLAVLWVHPQVYVDVGAIVYALPRAEFYRYLQRVVEAGFGKRVMFGSDQMVWPGVIERAIEAIESAPFLSTSQKRDILYNNAARFLRFSEADIARHHGR